MATSSQDSKERIRSQIENNFGKVSYSLTAHEKEIQTLKSSESKIKIAQIILSAIASGSFITAFLSQYLVAKGLAAIISVVLLCLNSYSLKFDLATQISAHTKAADNLWIVREDYLSLLTDFNDLTIEKIREQRDFLQKKTAETYSSSPRTTNKSYKETQRALKDEEEQYFTIEELNQLLPPAIRHD